VQLAMHSNANSRSGNRPRTGSDYEGWSSDHLFLEKEYGQSGFKALRVVSSTRSIGMESISPMIMVNGFEVQLGSLSINQLKSVLEGLR
jgi:hypothetical protein